MNELFDSEIVAVNSKKQLDCSVNVEATIKINAIRKAIEKWQAELKGTTKNEQQLKPDFIREIFTELLDYSKETGAKEVNLKTETKTDLDGTKPDAILGFFNKNQNIVRVIVEFKSPNTNLDKKQNRKDFQGSSVEQAFSYVSKYQGAEWVIVSNFNEIRLYRSNYSGSLYRIRIEDIAKESTITKIQEFYYIFCKKNLIGENENDKSILIDLVEKNKKKQKEITDKFYAEYKEWREKIVNNVLKSNEVSVDIAIQKTQKLFDRLIFVIFCEKKQLITQPFKIVDVLQDHSDTWNGLSRLFKSIDEGAKNINKFNGGLFKKDEQFDNLNIGLNYIDGLLYFLRTHEFKSKLTVHILGHIFEQSISDLEKLKAQLSNETFDEKVGTQKKDGVFYTPEYITQYIVKEAIEGWLNDSTKHLQDVELITDEELQGKQTKQIKRKINAKIEYLKNSQQILSSIKVLDPACGSGAFLVEVFRFLQNKHHEINDDIQRLGGSLTDINWNYVKILQNNIYGVDINFESVQITKLSLWLETVNSNDELTTLDGNIKTGNSLIDDPNIAGAKAFNWQNQFPSVFKNGGFDVVVGNPPYVGQKGNSELFVPFQKLYPEFYDRKQDLYYYFIYKGLSLLNRNGYISYIVPPYFLTATSAINLRKEILKNGIKSFSEIKANVFDSASIHSLIFLFNKNRTSENNFNVYQLKKERNLINTYNQNELNQDNWYILGSGKDIDIKVECKTLGEIAKISPGIQTGFDKAYIIQKEELSKFSENERKFIKKFYKNSHIQRYTINESEEYIILANLIDNIDLYSNIKKCILEHKSRLDARKRNFALNKADKEGKWWYFQTYRPSVNFEGEKIVLPYRSPQNNFVVSRNQFYSLTDIYYITIFDKNYNIEFLSTILNSKFIYIYLLKNCKRKGDVIEYGIEAINSIPIPQIPFTDQQPFIQKAQTMLTKTKELNEISSAFLDYLKAKMGNPEKLSTKLQKWYNLKDDEFLTEITKIAKAQKLTSFDERIIFTAFKDDIKKAKEIQSILIKTDAEIDKTVYALYGLSEEEIAVIEASC